MAIEISGNREVPVDFMEPLALLFGDKHSAWGRILDLFGWDFRVERGVNALVNTLRVSLHCGVNLSYPHSSDSS